MNIPVISSSLDLLNEATYAKSVQCSTAAECQAYVLEINF